MNRAPWLWYAWAFLTAYGLMADRRWLLAPPPWPWPAWCAPAPAVSPRLSNANCGTARFHRLQRPSSSGLAAGPCRVTVAAAVRQLV